MASEKRAAISVFCSYSEEDRRLQEKLEKHLTNLEREGSLRVWAKHKVQLGQVLQREIDAQFMQARLILLLISANFFSSTDCIRDLTKAFERHRDANVVVIPILLRSCTWDDLAFRDLLVLPRNHLPVSRWSDQDEAFTQIVAEIKQVADDLRLYGDMYMEPLQPPPGTSDPTQRRQSTVARQQSRITQATNGRQHQSRTRSRNQTNILNEEATLPANTRILNTLPRSRSASRGSRFRRFLSFFFGNISGKAFNQRCKRWKGNSAWLMFLYVLLDLGLLPYIVNQRTQSLQITTGVLCLSALVFLIGVCNQDDAIGLPVAVLYFPAWLAMGIWYVNTYLHLGWSQLSLLLLVVGITAGRLLLFQWRSPFGQR